MAKITKLPSGNWRTKVYLGRDASGKVISESVTAPTKDEVIVKVGEIKKNGSRKQKTSMTVREAIEKYIELSEPILSPSTVSNYRKYAAHSFASIMDLPVDELTDNIMQNAINLECRRTTEQRGTQVAPKTVKNEWGLVSSSLRTICKLSFMVRLPKVQHKNESLPNPLAIIEAVSGTKVELPCLLAMCCSLRMSEIRGLDASSVHGDEIWIDKVVIDVDRVPTLKPLGKTDSSVRKVKISQRIKDLINISMQEDNPIQIGNFKPLIPMNADQIYHAFTRRMAKRGIKMTFHDLRKEYASIGLNILKLPPKTVQVGGGWSTPDVMNRIYSQTFNEEQLIADKIRTEFIEGLYQKVSTNCSTKSVKP